MSGSMLGGHRKYTMHENLSCTYCLLKEADTKQQPKQVQNDKYWGVLYEATETAKQEACPEWSKGKGRQTWEKKI